MRNFKGKTVLVVDDEPELREVLKDELEYFQFTVLEAENGMKAFDVIVENKVDVIISDIRMPGGSGIELLEKLNAHFPRLPVLIFMSGYTDLTPDEAYDKGAAGILAKPFNTEAMLDQLERLLDPIPRRWERKAERIDVSQLNEIQIQGFKEMIGAKILNIGTGGMFIALREHVPAIGELIAFKLFEKNSPNEPIEIKGIVRWVRRRDMGELKRGFGLEFQGVDDQSAKKLFEIVERLQPKSFIPKD